MCVCVCVCVFIYTCLYTLTYLVSDYMPIEFMLSLLHTFTFHVRLDLKIKTKFPVLIHSEITKLRTTYTKMERSKSPRTLKERFSGPTRDTVSIYSSNHLLIYEVICTGGSPVSGRLKNQDV